MRLTKAKLTKYLSIVGAHFIASPWTFSMIFGNLSEYLASYVRHSCPDACGNDTVRWILPIFGASFCPGLFFMRRLISKIGLKGTGLLTMGIHGLSFLGSAWTMNVSMFWTAVMLGALNGICTSMSVCISYLYIQHWASDNAAILVASISCFPNLLSVLQNQVMTAVVNPENLQPDVQDGRQVYFSQPEVLERVPRAIILQAIMTICLQILGYLLVSTPPSKSASAPDAAFDVRPDAASKDLNKFHDSTGSKARAILNSLENDSLLDTEKDHVNGNSIKSNTYTTSQIGCENKCPNIHDLAKGTRFIAQNINDGIVTNDNEEVPPSHKPSQVIQTSVFWTLWFSWIALSYSMTMAFNFYKQFALLFIPDDYFLTFLGSVIPIGSSAARLTFGHFIDKNVLRIKDNLIISLASHSVLFAFWFFIPRIHKFVYLFFILSLTIPQSIFYVVFPPAVIRIFGSTHFSTILGLLNSAQTVSGLVLAVLVTPVIERLGWFWFYMTCSVLNLLALVSVTVSTKIAA